MQHNFIIADFMGEKRCKCNDNGWDGNSRSIHYPCVWCKEEHRPEVFNYDCSINVIIPVLEKLKEKHVCIDISNKFTGKYKWVVSHRDHAVYGDDLPKMLAEFSADIITKLKDGII